MTTRILAAGGTFDKRYNPLTGALEFGHSHLAELLNIARFGSTVTLDIVMQIDSLDMQDAHRLQLLERCKSASESALVIVHGTDTMTITANVLAQAKLDKTIVITGAMVPYAIEQSDAQMNLGYALGCVSVLPSGVYIAMNGAAHRWDKVRKNRDLGRFEPI